MTNPKFFKIIISILLFAVVALIYAHQEVEILKTSFLINKHNKELSFLLDRYRALVYNLSQLESPERIEKTLSVNEIALCMPKVENRHYHEGVGHAYNEAERETKESFLARVFDRFSLRAEAKVVK